MNTAVHAVLKNSPDALVIKQAAEIIRRGGLVAFPTETVYGLGADGTRDDAAHAIYRVKGRPADNPLILHIADPTDAEKYTYVSPLYEKLANAFMPGPLTVIMSAKETVPLSVRASLPTVAVRCPSHPVAQALIRASGTAIAAPSANLSGSPSPTCARHVYDDMQGRIDMILDGGDCDIGLESTIVKILDDQTMLLLRPGAITVEQLSKLANVQIADAVKGTLKEGQVAESPGMKYKHYAPKAELILLKGNDNARQNYILSQLDSSIAVLCYHEELSLYGPHIPEDRLFDLGKADDVPTHCNRLFRLLRQSDLPNVTRIFAPLPLAEGMGLALYNRMIRAAAHRITEI